MAIGVNLSDLVSLIPRILTNPRDFSCPLKLQLFDLIYFPTLSGTRPGPPTLPTAARVRLLELLGLFSSQA